MFDLLRSCSSFERAIFLIKLFVFARFSIRFVQIPIQALDLFKFLELTSSPISRQLFVPLFQRYTKSKSRVLRARMPGSLYSLCGGALSSGQQISQVASS